MNRLALPMILVAAILACGCANETDDSPNKLVLDKAEGPCTEVLAEGDWYRFTLLQVKEISGATSGVVDSLNGLWAVDIGKFELNVLIEIIEVGAQNVTLRMVSAARAGLDTDPPLCQIPASSVELVMPITDTGLGKPAEKVSMNIYAGSIAAPKNCATDGRPLNAIPLINAEISLSCEGDTGLVSGQVIGALGKTALANTCTCITIGNPDLSELACGILNTSGESTDDNKCGGCVGDLEDGTTKEFVSLVSLLNSLNGGKDLDYSETDETGGPAARVTATFNAEKYDQTPAICPGL